MGYRSVDDNPTSFNRYFNPEDRCTVRAVFKRLVRGATQEEDHTKLNSKPAAVDFQRYRIYNGYTTDISNLPGGCIAPNQVGYTFARYQPMLEDPQAQ
jgi:hypothetical protein